MSSFQNVFILDFIAAKGEGGGSNNRSYKTSKAPVKCHDQQTDTVFYRPDALPVAQPTVSKH